MVPSQQKPAHELPYKESQGQRWLQQEPGSSQVYTGIGDRQPSLHSASTANKPLQDLGKMNNFPIRV